MSRLRRVLGPCALAWLLCQATTLAAGAAACWQTAPASTDLEDCTCEHGDGVMCPMHHAPASGSRCLIRSADGGQTAVLGWLFHGVGLMPTEVAAIPPAPHVAVVGIDVSTRSLHPAPPDPPPPRA